MDARQAFEYVFKQLNVSVLPRNAQEKSKEKKKDAVPAGDVEAASIEELNQKITTLEKEKNKEEEYRNYMQLERVSAAGIAGPVQCLQWLPLCACSSRACQATSETRKQRAHIIA